MLKRITSAAYLSLQLYFNFCDMPELKAHLYLFTAMIGFGMEDANGCSEKSGGALPGPLQSSIYL
jgi:hypothetical protein